MNLNKTLLSLTAIGFAACAGAQSTSASGILTQIGSSGGVQTYDISLHNTGTTGIQTFWFAWIPFEDFLSANPSSIVSPTAWSLGEISHDFNQGYGIQWVGNIASGNTIDGFKFNSTDTLAQLAGNSTFDTGTPVTTSFVYSGPPETGTSAEFVVAVSSAPEPESWLALGGLGLVAIGSRRKRAKAV